VAAQSKPRSIWNGWLSWGTVNVPVKLYSAVQDKSIHFNQLHGKDGARIKQKRINPRTGDEVPYDRIVRGYEVSPDKWVVLTKEDAQAAEGSRAKVIDIEEFVAQDEIDPVFFDKPYWIGPQEGGEHAYAVVEKKAKGEEIEIPESEPEEETDDLMAALEASLSGGKS
jgi:DNA end-binding protein Ku